MSPLTSSRRSYNSGALLCLHRKERLPGTFTTSSGINTRQKGSQGSHTGNVSPLTQFRIPHLTFHLFFVLFLLVFLLSEPGAVFAPAHFSAAHMWAVSDPSCAAPLSLSGWHKQRPLRWQLAGGTALKKKFKGKTMFVWFFSPVLIFRNWRFKQICSGSCLQVAANVFCQKEILWLWFLVFFLGGYLKSGAYKMFLGALDLLELHLHSNTSWW